MNEPLSSKPMTTPDNSKVICPNCCHQFGAICVDDQKERSAREAEIERLLAALKEAMEWNWLDEESPPPPEIVRQCEQALHGVPLPPRLGVETSGCVAPPRAQHGRDCPKVQHVGEGYLHSADDDRPYEVDGLVYCGRCHGWLDRSQGVL